MPPVGIEWNLWHGCRKKSEGCLHCYVHRRDARYGIPDGAFKLNKSFNLPILKEKDGSYKHKSGTKFVTCFTSDFFLEEADEWRTQAWDFIRERYDCEFMFFTKRIERFRIGLPKDWGSGWEHVTIGCTCENQIRAEERLPIFMNLPIKHKYIIVAPMLGPVEICDWLDGIDAVSIGGESGTEARPCNYEWVLDLRRQCIEKKVPFIFHQTGANFIKNGKQYHIKRQMQHSQARKAGINYMVNAIHW